MHDQTAGENLDATWGQFKEGLDKVFFHISITKKEYIKLYTLVYDYYTFIDRSTSDSGQGSSGLCLQNNSSHMLGSSPNCFHSKGKNRNRTMRNNEANLPQSSSKVTESSSPSDGPISNEYSTIAAAKFYEKVRDYLKTFVAQIRDAAANYHDEQLLDYFYEKWLNYRFSSKTLNGLLAYVNNHFIPRQRYVGHTNYVEIYELALNTWRENVVKKLHQRIFAALLGEITLQRKKESQFSASLPGARSDSNQPHNLSMAAKHYQQHFGILDADNLSRITNCYVEISFNDLISSQRPEFLPSTHDYLNIDSINTQNICQHFLNAGTRFVLSSSSGAANDLSLVCSLPQPISGSCVINATTLTPPVSNPLVTINPSQVTEQLGTPKWYQEYLERPYLSEMRKFYEQESQAFLLKHSITEFMGKAESRIIEELARVERCLHHSTKVKVLFVLSFALVVKHKELLTKEFDNLLTQKNVADLTRLFNLISLTLDGVKVLVKNLQLHVATRGTQAIEEVASSALSDPRLYIQTLLNVYKYYEDLLKNAFNDYKEFLGSLDKGCAIFINKNKVTELANDPRKSAELLAKYCDILLKKGQRDANFESEESLFKDVMIIHKYLEDRDVFQKFYSKCLCRRLINGPNNHEDENDMINRFKEACGYDYTTKLQRMIQDMQTSQTLRDDFNRENKSSFEFFVMVLTTHAWPVNPNISITLPSEMQIACNLYSDFYSSKHSGRRLTWVYSYGRGELVTNYLKTRYSFVVSTLQMVVLSIFNNHISISCSRLLEMTAISWAYLSQILNILLKYRLLLLDGGNQTSASFDESMEVALSPSESNSGAPSSNTNTEFNLTENSNISLNMNYKNKKVRINLQLTVKAEQKQETEQTIATVEQDRKMIIEATIVRIMKARKELNHAQLVAMTISEICFRFNPPINVIKRCIDVLIEREYICRNQNDRELYHYVA